MYYVIHASHLFGQKTQRHTVIILLMDLIELGNIHHLQDLRWASVIANFMCQLGKAMVPFVWSSLSVVV